MDKSVYIRKAELYRAWNGLYNVNNLSMSFEDYQKVHEKEDKIYKQWLFYDKLLKRMEVVKYGNKKKKCNKKANSTYKRSKETITI